ncbi:hypothetical protein [Bacteroides helcogenes]|uniref:Lipoprotein n=1 Tax=Bacteroides helcogenes (strain ATCC 35417 / DSM 20613 / JCM 6297 / CCUG 15421 / P 36-108) TaxID=693979 RepID=E6SR79_BACT6|nr:hypothetical protein [Bacteroides helcogenes]ADV43023.1 hypothetical protein Bache_1012 [Bacteroides helcogenes P 36-108]MDY5236932.1 hypothetical protein [Bacteroides helcogenes]
MKSKSLFKITILCLAMIAGCINLTACGDSDDEPEVTNELTTIKTTFSVSLSNDWYKFFDIEVTYTSETGEKTITLTQDWMYEKDIPYSAEPDEFLCKVIAKPKANSPAIDANTTYLLEQSVHAEVSGILKDGTIDLDYGLIGSKSGKDEMNSTGMEKYIKGEHRLLSFSFIPEE